LGRRWHEYLAGRVVGPVSRGRSVLWADFGLAEENAHYGRYFLADRGFGWSQGFRTPCFRLWLGI